MQTDVFQLGRWSEVSNKPVFLESWETLPGGA
jgi:hypothetical protein